MLYVVAVDARGAAGARLLWRDDADGRLVRIGEHPTCDLRLPGAGIATSDLWCDSEAWRVRRPDGSVANVIDGDAFVVGCWSMLLLVGEAGRDTAHFTASQSWSSHAPMESTRWFEVGGRRVEDLDDGLPRLLGGSDGCAVRIDWTRERVSAVVRDVGRWTRLYPIPGTTLTRNDVPVTAPIVLMDGDVLAVSDAPSLRFVDTDQEIDRLLDSLRGDAPEPPGEGALPLAGRTTDRSAHAVGLRSDAFLSRWEAALAGGTVVALISQVIVTIARW